jgi:2-amino-4-hydroxy-6-hydroxymethyldihydropteridine diphosphokinase
MEIIYLLLGSNVGDRSKHLADGRSLIAERIGEISKSSHVYETAPWGFQDQDDFYNQAIEVKTERSPKEVLKISKEIEAEVGRVSNEKWHPRVLDIDILLFGKKIIHEDGLNIPHASMHERNFALIPLMELAPELIHPSLELSIEEIFWNCKDELDVIRLDS